jgi:hypothetical protein
MADHLNKRAPTATPQSSSASCARALTCGRAVPAVLNVAPTRFQPVLVRGSDGERELRCMLAW